MKIGKSVFGPAYEKMLENDLHDPASVDIQFLERMILLEKESHEFLYARINRVKMDGHELKEFAQRFKKADEKSTIQSVLDFTHEMASSYEIEFENMLFGGSEKEILARGTDWCADMARVAAVLLDCLDIPCRILHLANLDRAYNGHVVNEAFYEGKYGVLDPIQGILFYEKEPIDAYQIQCQPDLLHSFPDDYSGLYQAIAINEYDPMDQNNHYTVSKANQYYRKLIETNHRDQWIMREDILQNNGEERVRLKNRTEETVRIYFDKAQDPQIKKMLPQKAKTVEEALEDYQLTLRPDTKSYGRIILVEGEYVGDIWCYGLDVKEDPNAMLSFCIFEKTAQSKGIATQAVELFLKEIQLKFGLKTIGAFAFAENIASIRVLEKNGFRIMEESVEEGRKSVYLQLFYQN